MRYNKDQKTRDSMLTFVYGDESHFLFEKLDLETFEKLVEMKFIDLTERQNDAPSIGVFLRYMREHPTLQAHGYACGGQRWDYRIAVEGLHGCLDTQEEIDGFLKRFKRADELSANQNGYVRCWYD